MDANKARRGQQKQWNKIRLRPGVKASGQDDTHPDGVRAGMVRPDTVRTDICALIGELFFGKAGSLPRLSQDPDWGAICSELREQTISLLFSDDLIRRGLDEQVLERWRKTCFGSFRMNLDILNVQQWLYDVLTENSIPFMVVKGAAAAVLYPRPILRTQGDIDIVIAPEWFHEGLQTLIREGCERDGDEAEDSRHINLLKDGVIIELHSRFAKLSSSKAEALLDRWIFEAIPDGIIDREIFGMHFPAPPDVLNGLILLTHINMHLEEGLGLRQIIDWMMYVYRHMDDGRWPVFRNQAAQLGLERLAVAVTRMCQLYLGLPEEYPACSVTEDSAVSEEDMADSKTQRHITWCRDADDKLCADLLEYLFDCGNFGFKHPTDNTAAMVISHGRGVRGFFRNLQTRGEANWDLYRRHGWLKPFAWIYQGCRYARIALGRKDALPRLKQSVEDGRRRGDLMDRLGATSLARKK